MAFTSQQLILEAIRISKAPPGYGPSAGLHLNSILDDLARNYDFDIQKVTNFTLTLGSVNPAQGPYPLPANYLRACPDEVEFMISGVPTILIQRPLAALQNMFIAQGTNNYPDFFATDFSTVQTLGYPTAWIWPAVAGGVVLNWHYFKSHTPIVTPETSAVVPWFPSDAYLLSKLSANLMMVTGDDRMGEFEGKAQAELTRYLKMKDDPEGYAQVVTLDRNAFSNRDNLPATKVTVF